MPNLAALLQIGCITQCKRYSKAAFSNQSRILCQKKYWKSIICRACAPPSSGRIRPLKKDQAEVARKRFAFEEIFFIQLEKQAARREYEKNPSFSVQASNEAVGEFVKRFPFPATEAQNRAIESIVDDMKRGKAMSRLLEGDVGSGKTAVAAAAAYAVVTSRPAGQKFGNLQVAYMCPTEILRHPTF